MAEYIYCYYHTHYQYRISSHPRGNQQTTKNPFTDHMSAFIQSLLYPIHRDNKVDGAIVISIAIAIAIAIAMVF